ncbi:hypothetical protein [Gelidibacter japonicus]|uniref:hypothetical protein n=1 Tax=Gelidibacter japonicus TaxID=1962232 RepID=UPI003A94A619
MKTRIKKKEYYFFIEEQMFTRLEKLVEENNKIHTKGKYKLKLDVAVFFIDYIQMQTIKRKDKLENGYVRLKAKYLSEYHKNYATYINFLIKEDFIKRIPYDLIKKKCHGFKIILPMSEKGIKRNIMKYSPLDFTFNKKVMGNPHYLKAKKRADRKCSHLTKWLNSESISFNYEGALEYIHSLDINDNKLFKKRYCIEAFKEGQIHYSRSGKDDRLHSNLTNMPSDLRRFVSHKNENLISLDLKSSQPFLLAGILNLCLLEDYARLERIIEMLYKDIGDILSDVVSVTIPKTSDWCVNKGVRAFINLVLNEDIYVHIGSKFSEKFLKSISNNNGFRDKIFNKNKNRKVFCYFDTIRDFSKKAMLEYLYCSTESPEKRYSEIRRIFPDAVNEFVDEMKAINKNDFPIILQNIEAHLFLDEITREIALERPSLFIATIHDSIIVPEGNEEYVERKMIEKLTSTFGIVPTIKQECWCDSLQIAS